jgi:HAE1 family hydrophobic/amphiphilic exporter-1
VRYAPEFRESVEDIENILVYNSSGNGIRIKDLDSVERMVPPTLNVKTVNVSLPYPVWLVKELL